MDEYVGELKDNWLSFFLSISCVTLSGLFGERVFEGAVYWETKPEFQQCKLAALQLAQVWWQCVNCD